MKQAHDLQSWVVDPKLFNSTKFPNGMILLTDHAHGKAGKLHFKGLARFAEGVKIVYPELF